MNFDPSLPTSYEYIHYTNENIDTLDLNRAYTQTAHNLAFHKPNGLWLSVTGIYDWEKYCLKNNYNLMNLKYEFQVKLNPHAKILVLHNNAALDVFEKNYAYRWEEIIKDYQGLVLSHILPKLYNMNLWCDSWRCTSACIWDLQAVEKVDRLGIIN
jgi:hypothetical protein